MNLPSLFHSNNPSTRWLSRIQQDFDRLFSELSNAEPLMSAELGCRCEVTEDKSNYTCTFDMPGVKKSDVNVQLDGNTLTVSAERSEEKKTEGKKKRYSEVNYGSYLRSFTLPESVDGSKIDAKFENGVLKVTIPKIASSNSKQIAVQ